MSEQLTVLLAGRMSEPRAEWLAEQLTTDWRIEFGRKTNRSNASLS